MFWRKALQYTLILSAFNLIAIPSEGQIEDARALSLKAAYIFNFTKFIKWPSMQANINLCIPADNNFIDAFQGLEKKPTSYGRIRLITFEPSARIEECHILFVPQGQPSLQHLTQLSDGLLIVSEDNALPDEKWIINFFLEQNKLRFNINLKAARLANLNISSKLLRLASDIIQ